MLYNKSIKTKEEFEMTRGYIVIKKGRKIIDIWYANSDCYFDAENENLMCFNVVKAFKAENTAEYLRQNIKDICNIEDVEKPDNLFYIKTKANKNNFFVDYVYEFDERTEILTIYNYGRKTFVFKKDEIKYLDYLIKNHNEIYDAFAYDEKTLSNIADWEKQYMDFVKNKVSFAEIDKEIKERKSKISVLLDFYYHADVFDCYHCKKRATIMKNGEKLGEIYFCFSPVGTYLYTHEKPKKYEIYVQFPNLRIGFITAFKGSRKTMEKKLIERLKDPIMVEKLQYVAPMFKEMNEVNEKEEQREMRKKKQREILKKYPDFNFCGVTAEKYERVFLS